MKSKSGKTTFTVKEFAEEFRLTEEYVRQMCRRQVVKGKKESLPPGWRAEKVGRDWFIHLVEGAEAAVPEWFFREEEIWAAERDRTELILDECTALFGCAEEMAERWYQRACKSVDELSAATSDTPVYRLTNRWQHLITWLRGERKNVRPPKPQFLRNHTGFVTNLGEAYKFSMLSEKEVTVEVTFQPNGEWTMELIKPDDEPLLLDRISFNRTLFTNILIWAYELVDRVNAKYRRHHNQVPVKSAQCIHCGKPLLGLRSSTFDAYKGWYCPGDELGTPSRCKENHNKFIESLKYENPSDCGQRIAKRIKKLSRHEL